jgi:NifU-like protein involved in Fe-S cluster formation
MDRVVIAYYRRLLREGFKHAGKLDKPDVFVDSIGEKIQVCGSLGRAYMHIYVNLEGSTIREIRYLCTCDPTANVVIEILCSLVEGKTMDDAEALTEDDFVAALGGGEAEFRKRARDTIELLARGLGRFTGG